MNVIISRMLKAREVMVKTWWVGSKIFILLYLACLRLAAERDAPAATPIQEVGGEGGR